MSLHLWWAGWVPLSPQEAYYWQWARHLDLSYFDHPPLAAWTIRATTALFGQGERAVRLAATWHGALFALFFIMAGRRLFGARTALLAVVAALSTPLFALGQTVITPDGPLLAGWTAALYFTVRALQSGRGPWLLAAGAAVGYAVLGKYSGWLLAPQILLALLFDRRGRALLLGPWPYLALLLAVAMFAPVLVWNAREGWISFAFQGAWRSSQVTAPRLDRFGRFLGLQALEMTPLLWLAAVAAVAVAMRRARDPGFRLCAIFALPTLALCLAASPFLWVKANWAAPAYCSALLAAAALCPRAPGAGRAFARASVGLAFALTVYLHLAVALPALPFPARDDVTAGWKELAARVQAERERIAGPSFVVGCTYKPASELAYYLPGQPEVHAQNAFGELGLEYGYWLEPATLVGREGIVVLDGREWRNCIEREAYCRPLQELPPLTVRRGSRAVTTFRLWRCRYVGARGASP